MPMDGRRMMNKSRKTKAEKSEKSKKNDKVRLMLRKSVDAITATLFPPRCLVCDDILEPEDSKKGIHLACENKLYPIYGAVCMHCGRPLGDRNSNKQNQYESEREYCLDCGRIVRQSEYNKGSFCITQGKSLYIYKGAIKKAMYRFKYSNRREYASFFAKQAVERYGSWMQKHEVEVIVPVPMYARKQRLRGYNQAESFARQLSWLTGIPVNTQLVYRKQDTKPLKTMDPIQRKNNLKNAFQMGESVVQYKCAMVVDDIYTTGSTAEAVAQELIKQGTRKVYLLTVCIGGDM